MISLLIVNYHSAALATNAIRSARRGTRGELQVVVVDNSCSATEADALRPLADVVIAPDANLGYAGGINLGRRSCGGETLVVSNPDIIVADGALDRLHEQLNDQTAVAGPALYWDDAHEWMFPPADLNTTAKKSDEVLASRSPRWFAHRDRRRIRERIAFWSLEKPTTVRGLSGALMAIRARDFDDIGGFDERFSLYFEEIDFCRRVTEHGKRIVYVPGAKCRHLYNQSAGTDMTAAGSAYARSELRYLEKWSGPFAARLLKHLERIPPSNPIPPTNEPIAIDRPDLLVEVSPLPNFATAAGLFPRGPHVDLPPEVWATIRTSPTYMRVVERATARVLATYARYGS
jgi:GT2 family glycosyltransferase